MADEDLEFKNEEKSSLKDELIDYGLTILALIISMFIAVFISFNFLI